MRILTSCWLCKSRQSGPGTISDLRKCEDGRAEVVASEVPRWPSEYYSNVRKMALTCGNVTRWSYGDSNPGLLACHLSP
jgi:hypothetical protein